ncbi:MAG TPA: type II and III secretion system protein [Bryobacteraceae bacterium]|nr:type II and III secretion system protein [Bryobacteraceae bacterium]
MAQSARDLYRQGRKAEERGELARAYLLYAAAAAVDPGNRGYWARSQALRTKAVLESSPVAASMDTSLTDLPDPEQAAAESLLGKLTDLDLKEARELLPPPELRPALTRTDFDLKLDSKQLFEKVAAAYGLDVVFDGDFKPSPPIRFAIQNAGFREALRALEAASASFIVPISERLFLAVNDSPQKRAAVEPTVAAVIPIPEPVSIQEAQELARAVQQTMEIPKFVIDSQRRIVVMRDRVSKIQPAQALFHQMLAAPGQVSVEVEFLEVNKSSSLSYGLNLQRAFPIVAFGKLWNSKPSIPSGFTRFLTFGGGKTLFGIGITDPEIFASMSKFNSQTLLLSEIRSVDGQPATLHIGDKYPIITGGYYGDTSGTGQVYTPPPTFNFEDLGVEIKITPHVHGAAEVSLELEAEYKVLTGETLNAIPVISTRRFVSTVRLKTGEWAVVGGLLNSSEAKTITGLAGLSSIPILGPLMRQNTRDKTSNEVLLVLKPKLLTLPPREVIATRSFWVGTDTRPIAPI